MELGTTTDTNGKIANCGYVKLDGDGVFSMCCINRQDLHDKLICHYT